MLKWITKKLVGSKNAREIKKMQPMIAAVGELEPAMKKKSDAELKAMTPYFREKLDQGAPVDELLIEAFATVREVGRRVLEMRHYDVQLIGGMVLHRGQIAEMKTGEGKTLVATLPIYLNALSGKGVHLVTVNDYLATRDAEWMGKIYKFLGLSVGTIWHDMPDRERQRAYRCDVTYGQNNEFGFDYLRDNMKESIELYVQRELNFAIVDEVDSILIDEARTPLIISGLKEESAGLYHRCNEVVLRLKKDVDYTVDEKAHSSMLTDSGVEKVEKQLSLSNLYDPANISWVHHITQALQAHTLYKRNQQYLIEEGKVLIIDEFTGRKMPGRRWSDGLHQAIEAKENVNIEEETLTLATISFQNLFRLYGKLAGMTGTAETEAEEFYKIYKLDVTVIPTNRPLLRTDYDDVIYKSERFKFQFVIDEIVDCQQRGQPVLVGTASVDKSEVLSKMLRKRGVKHNVLNAKQHEREAGVIAQAGRKGAVTIATNMAGRGTDILLGGNPENMASEVADFETEPEKYQAALEKFRAQCAEERKEVIAVGGLHILGTERHEARRIDNQLRGRSGRQGDPGSARFYLSLEDDLLRVFGADRIQGLMERLGMKDDEPIEHRWVNKAIENAQKRVEGHNFDIRKHLLEYDDVMNQQRKSIYALRKAVLEGRYVPTLSEAEQKEGQKPEVPVKSGKWTVESLIQEIRPRVSEIVRGLFGHAAASADEPPEEGGEHPYREQPAPDPDKLDPEKLTRELYRNFGAMVSFEKHELKNESGVINKTSQEVAASLIQQRERILDLMDMAIADAIDVACPEKAHADEWDLGVLEEKLLAAFNAKITLGEVALDRQHIAERVWEQAEKLVEAREAELSLFYFLYFARHFYLDEIDAQWIDHLRAMDYLRQGIGLEGYGQRDPKQIYKRRGFDMFSEMMSRIQANVTNKLFRIQIEREEDRLPAYERKRRRMTLGRGDVPGGEEGGEGKVKTVRRSSPRIGRNDPCPCGSGKKYKKCCMARDEAAAG